MERDWDSAAYLRLPLAQELCNLVHIFLMQTCIHIMNFLEKMSKRLCSNAGDTRSESTWIAHEHPTWLLFALDPKTYLKLMRASMTWLDDVIRHSRVSRSKATSSHVGCLCAIQVSPWIVLTAKSRSNDRSDNSYVDHTPLLMSNFKYCIGLVIYSEWWNLAKTP